MNTLKKYKFKYGSVQINYEKNKNDEYKKKPVYDGNWQDCKINKDFNSFYVITGEASNIVVVDIDDMKNEYARKIMVKAEKCCNLITETLKGRHYYFSYNTNFPRTIHKKQYALDLLSNGSHVFAPPSNYRKEDNKIQKYVFIKQPEKKDINPMSIDLEMFLLELCCCNKQVAKVIRSQNTISKNEIKDVPQMDDGRVEALLSKLSAHRSKNYSDWISCGMALKCSGYNFNLWNNWSKSYEGYDESECLYVWNSFKPNKISIGTIFYWLKQDDVKAFEEFYLKEKFEKYEVKEIVDLKFNVIRFREYFFEDIEQLGNSNFIQSLSRTNSFKYFNKYHLFMRYNNNHYLIKNNGRMKDLIKIEHFSSAYSEFKIGVHMWTDLWNACHHKNIYSFMNFDPNVNEQSDDFNLFQGFKYEDDTHEIDMNLVNPYLEHVKYLCSENESYQYVLNWISHLVQRPNIKTNVALVLYSDIEGIGKNFCIEPIQKFLEGYWCKIQSIDDLTKGFNAQLKGKIICIGDEIHARARDLSGVLKNHITQKHLNIEMKGRDSVLFEDYLNYIFTTNDELVFKVSSSDRRFHMIECPTKKRSDSYYSNFLKNVINNEEAIKNIFHYFLKRDITTFNIGKFPMTEYKKRNMENSLPAYFKMMIDEKELFDMDEYSAKDLYKRSIKFARLNYLSSVYSYQLFNRKFKLIFGDYEHKKNTGLFYKIPREFLDELDESYILQKLMNKKDDAIPKINEEFTLKF